MKTYETIIVGLVIMLLSFPLLYVVMLLATGNAQLVFKGDLAHRVEVETMARQQKRSDVRDSLIVQNTYSFMASTEERDRLGKDREHFVREQDRLQVMVNELQDERALLEQERRLYEEAFKENNEKNELRIKKLARVYEAMKAPEAARILETLDDTLCLEIFKNMTEDRQKAKILSAIRPEKATRLSQKMGIKLPSKATLQ